MVCPRPDAVAKLYFYYASMNAGKSTNLLQADFNYRERGMRTVLLTAAIDDRFAKGTISSRIGLTADAIAFDRDTDLIATVLREGESRPACVLVDEAQFLTASQVDQLATLADVHNVPVLAYGLRTDFLGSLFEGSARLLAIADSLVEIKSVCACGRKATMNLRVDASGRAVAAGAQTEIGGNDLYIALCRRHFNEALASAA
jgi:thymidine kinase